MTTRSRQVVRRIAHTSDRLWCRSEDAGTCRYSCSCECSLKTRQDLTKCHAHNASTSMALYERALDVNCFIKLYETFKRSESWTVSAARRCAWRPGGPLWEAALGAAAAWQAAGSCHIRHAAKHRYTDLFLQCFSAWANTWHICKEVHVASTVQRVSG